MNPYYALLLISVIVASAQITMKLAANFAAAGASFFEFRILLTAFISICLSVVGQIIWFFVLKSAPLSTSYIFLSLVFVLVPLAGWLIFNERLGYLHLLSIFLIMLGISALGVAETVARSSS